MVKIMKIFLRILSIFLIVVGSVFLSFGLGHDDTLLVTNYVVNHHLVKEDINILHLSDFHNHDLAYPNGNIIEMMESVDKDIVFLTGDLIDQFSDENDLNRIDLILNSFGEVPIIYVRGNHEYYSPMFEGLTNLLLESDVYILEDDCVTLKVNNSLLQIYGIHDPYREKINDNIDIDDVSPFLDEMLKKDPMNENAINILLSHRPEFMQTFTKYKFDYVFSGHTHGGQINMVWIGVPVIMGQGLFPHYTRGMYVETYEEHSSTLFLSAGIGMSNQFQIRYRCPPEIVHVTLKSV